MSNTLLTVAKLKTWSRQNRGLALAVVAAERWIIARRQWAANLEPVARTFLYWPNFD